MRMCYVDYVEKFSIAENFYVVENIIIERKGLA